jgi:hypothetical protein
MALIPVGIVLICFFSLRYHWDLDKLRGQLEEKALDRLARSTFAMGFLGLVALSEALMLVHGH